MSDSLVIIPTYNERENVENIVRAVFSEEHPFHILIVDDNSPDGTQDIVRELQKEFPDRLFLHPRAGKMGLGTAYIEGFKIGLDNGYEYIFEMDADFSHNPKDLIRLRQACQNGGDVAVGSRYCKGGRVSNWPVDRILMSYFASLYVRIILWVPIKDTTAGFICYTAKVLKSIDLNRVRFIGYAFQIEMKYRAHKKGFWVKEVPITFVDRRFGVSKMSMGIFKEAVVGVLKMKFMKL
ncbi:polyprenol monophosphomannose synthase [Luteibaculum oceani]|uniref:Polyprenol monophosphomannose synthase n=1 Tax=Luteibaculum oceani TaxID=1294296 RepID=A0A5C6V072_9FLAO|nr:polyprenol monophosphomannose synthase [Luteibaculum oceani]TXC78897.1 polyprenol monophosphomannose synthase [Luteibaculum oceani]